MQCPVDASTLLMSERKGVEIDYCPQCRGVWLDRGELDKLISAGDDWDDDDRSRRDTRDSGDHRPGNSYPPKRKRRWLSEMFEFD